MKNLLISLVFFGLCGGLSAQSIDIRHFDWLCGVWQNIKTGEIEQWSRSWDDMELKGISFKIAGNDTLISELMTIKEANGRLCFIADVPQNNAAVSFYIDSSSESGFACSNPDHDFPKFIRYELTARDSLYAEIEGDGKKIPFRFVKLKEE